MNNDGIHQGWFTELSVNTDFNQAGLKFKDPPVSASSVLGLKACTTTFPAYRRQFLYICHLLGDSQDQTKALFYIRHPLKAFKFHLKKKAENISVPWIALF